MSDLFISREQAEHDLLAAAAFMAERIRSSDGHAEAMATVLPMYLDRGDVDLAAELANAVADPHSRDRLLIRVAEKCALVDDDEYAVQLADAIEDHGLRSEAFELIGLAKAGQGKTAAALEIAELMNHPDLVFSAVAVHQAASGNEAGADETLAQIEFPTALTSALQSIADSQIENGKNEKAVSFLERAGASAEDIEHDEERIRMLCEIGNHFIEAGRSDLALETFDRARSYAELLDNVHKDKLLVMCSVGYLHAGNEDIADDTLDLVSDKTQMATALLAFARDSWRKEEKDEAIDTLEEALAILNSQKETEIRDSRTRNSLMAAIAAQFAVFENGERAAEVAQTNSDARENWSALSQIAQILTLQKKDEAARDTIELIDDDSSRVNALIMMSDAKQRLGESETAIELLDEAVSWAETIPQFVARSAAFMEISSRFAAHGLNDRIKSIGLTNLENIVEIKDESSQASAVANLAEVYSKAELPLGDDEKHLITKILARF